MDERVVAAMAGSVWGYPSVYGHQMRMAQAILSGRDCLAVLPTSAGKSLGYQLPQVCAPERGMALVIEPTIALMRDQGERLRLSGVEAVELHSSATPAQAEQALEAALGQRASFLHVSPECLSGAGFRARLATAKLSYVVVDEAHCIDIWGHDFRPEYGRIGEMLRTLPRVPILACSATLTPSSSESVEEALGLRDPERLSMSVFRPNIARAAMELGSREACDEFAVRAAHRYAPRGRCLIYAQTIRRATALAEAISASGLPSAIYHSKLAPGRRIAESDAFRSGTSPVMVATAAYGMGIDIPGLRTVVHVGLPASVEAYVQESGRAGRAPDETAFSVVGWCADDVGLHRFFRDRAWPSPAAIRSPASEREAAHVAEWLSERGLTPPLSEAWERAVERFRSDWDARTAVMVDALRDPGCLNQRLLRHFGETPPEAPCGACRTCLPEAPAGAGADWPQSIAERGRSISAGGPANPDHALRQMRAWLGRRRPMEGRLLGALARLPADAALAQAAGADPRLAQKWADWAALREPWRPRSPLAGAVP